MVISPRGPGLRPGASTLGCLVMLLLLAAVSYFGFHVGEKFLGYYRFRDAMRQEARFAGRNSDLVIRTRLRALADSIDLPDEAHTIRISRGEHSISISAEYREVIEGPVVMRGIRFNPRARGTF